MRVLVSGASGLIGSALVKEAEQAGHEITLLARRSPRQGERAVWWDPAERSVERQQLEGFDAVVHLAGENLMGRWTAEKKARIRNSRVQATRFLADSLGALEKPPKVFLCASAVGYYGDRGDQILDEAQGAGNGFLAGVARDWEAATAPLAQLAVRVVTMRFGVVLSTKGGALEKMLTPFKMGLGGPLGNGRQYVSWISLEDAVRAILFILTDPNLSGPVNVCAPTPVTNHDFAKTLGKILGRPTSMPVPAFAVRLAAGEMADEMLFASARMVPRKLLDEGFTFRDPDLAGALRRALEPSPAPGPKVSA